MWISSGEISGSSSKGSEEFSLLSRLPHVLSPFFVQPLPPLLAPGIYSRPISRRCCWLRHQPVWEAGSPCLIPTPLAGCTELSRTLCDPMDCSRPGSSVHGILQARILEWVVMPSSRESSQPREWTQVSCTAGRFFTSWASRCWGTYSGRRKGTEVAIPGTNLFVKSLIHKPPTAHNWKW